MRSVPKEKSILIAAHVVGWIIFITMPLINDPDLLDKTLRTPWIFILDYLLMIGYFYLNLCLLVPYFLFRKKLWTFIGITAGLYLFMCYAIPWIIHHAPFFEHPEMRRPPALFQKAPPFMDGDRFPGPARSPQEMMRKFGFFIRTTYFLIGFTVSTGIRVITQWYKEKQQLSELEKSKTQAELSFLKSQIHPHFLFNSLNSIYYLALSKDDKAPEAILSLSDFLRFVTTESDKNFIPLEKEIGMLNEYLKLQSLRTSEKIDLHFDVEGDYAYRKIMPLTFIPFVENAFKYGSSSHTDSFIHIRIRVDKGDLEFQIRNSVNPNRKAVTDSSGVGLKNISKRLALAYPERHVLEIKNDSSTFGVYLKIRL